MAAVELQTREAPAKDSFAALLDESLGVASSLEGTVVKGRVISVENDAVLIDVGLKSEGRVPLKEFAAGGVQPEIHVGDTVEVYLERMEDKNGEAQLSREKARREEAWTQLEKSFQTNDRVTGTIFGRVKGGFTVDLNGAVAFLPGSQVDIRPVRDITPLLGIAAALPDPQDGPLARQYRRVAPRRARGEPRRAALRAGRQPQGRPDPQRRRQEHHRLRRLCRSRRRRRIAACHRHRVAAHQPPLRGAEYRPERQGSGHPLQPRDAAHLARHEAARSRSVGGRRAQIPGRRQVQRPRHQHHRLRRLRRAGAGCRRAGPRLRDELDQEERASRQDRLDQPGGRGHGARCRSAEAPHQPRPQADPGQSVGSLRRGAPGRQPSSRARSATSPSSACSSACPATSTAWSTSPTSTGTGRAKRRSTTTARATRCGSRCSTSMSRRSASASASSSSKPIRSKPGWPKSRRAMSSPARSPAITDSGVEVTIGDGMPGFIRKSELSRDRSEQRPDRFAVGEKVDAKVTAIDRATRKLSPVDQGARGRRREAGDGRIRLVRFRAPASAISSAPRSTARAARSRPAGEAEEKS